jgi:hypothetical protein
MVCAVTGAERAQVIMDGQCYDVILTVPLEHTWFLPTVALPRDKVARRVPAPAIASLLIYHVPSFLPCTCVTSLRVITPLLVPSRPCSRNRVPARHGDSLRQRFS